MSDRYIGVASEALDLSNQNKPDQHGDCSARQFDGNGFVVGSPPGKQRQNLEPTRAAPDSGGFRKEGECLNSLQGPSALSRQLSARHRPGAGGEESGGEKSSDSGNPPPGVDSEIAERKRNEELVRRLSTAVEQCPVSVVITDPSGCITYVNRKFLECTGHTYEEAFGQNLRLLKSGLTSAEQYKHLWRSITAGNEWRGEFCNRKKNGELYWEYAVIRPIRDEKGHMTHFLAIQEDITERRSRQAQLHQAQKLEAIGQLAAGIARHWPGTCLSARRDREKTRWQHLV